MSEMSNISSEPKRPLPILLPPDFGKAFRRERKALGRTQQWVAEHAGLSRDTLIKLEAGENVGMHHALAALASLGKALNIVSARPDYDMIKEIFKNDE